MKNKRKTMIIISISAIIILLLIIIGLTYAFYSTRVIDNDENKSLGITTDYLDLTYEHGNTLVNEDLIPGESNTKMFTVKNTGTGRISSYGVYLENVINEFVNKQDLVVHVTCKSVDKDNEESGICNGISDFQFPDSDKLILSNSIEPGITHEYTITLEYLTSNHNQAGDMEKEVSAIIQIHTIGVILVDGVEYSNDNIEAALLASSDDTPLFLTGNVDISSDINITQSDRDFYINLNGYELSCSTCNNMFNFTGYNSTINVDNGVITTHNNASAFSIGKVTEDSQNINLNIGKQLVINTESGGIDYFGTDVTVNLYGTINIIDGYAIAGNGDSIGGEVNVYDGAGIYSDSPDSLAFYLTNLGTTNIYGGTISTDSVVSIKAGTINITGGTITAFGEKDTEYPELCRYAHRMQLPGDVIFVQLLDMYLRNVNINITAPALLNSVNGNIIRIHACGITDSTDSANIVNVTGKYITPMVDETVANMTIYN